MNLPKAILFDMDDTLIAFDGVSAQAWEKCCRDFIQHHSLNIPIDDILDELNKTRKWYWNDPIRHKAGRANLRNARREVVKRTLRAFDITEDEWVYELADKYSAYQNSLICLFPNTIETLDQLKSAGFRLGMVTNGTSEEQRAKIDRFGLNPFFEIILIEQEVGYGKPDIRVFEDALRSLDLPAHDVWMVGDNLVWDIQAPQRLGIYSVWFDYKKTGLPSHSSTTPDKIINHISELLLDL